MTYQTLADDNQFKFKCPIFNAETKMATCVKLRNLVWKGLTPEKRRGCQACMSAGKCPAAQIVQKMAMSGPRSMQPDDYGSTAPVLGKLRRDILERIRPVMVMSSTIQRLSLSSIEVNMIETANERIEAMLGSAPGASSKSKASIKGKARKPRDLSSPSTEPKQKTMSKVEQAAASGDLSAAR